MLENFPDHWSDHGRWPFSMVRFDGPTSIVWFLKEINLQSLWGPSLGVNQMWTKRNDHASKNECADFFLYVCSKRTIFNKSQVWPFSCLLLSSSSLVFIFSSPKEKIKFHHSLHYNNILYHGPLPFSTRAPLLPLPLQNMLDHVSGLCRPQNMSSRDLALHRPSHTFSVA
jgi:hypothetical protein